MRPLPERPFEEPWQARAFALAVVLVEEHGLRWDDFRDRLKSAVAADPDRPYWESWLAALDELVTTPNLPTNVPPRGNLRRRERGISP